MLCWCSGDGECCVLLLVATRYYYEHLTSPVTWDNSQWGPWDRTWEGFHIMMAVSNFKIFVLLGSVFDFPFVWRESEPGPAQIRPSGAVSSHSNLGIAVLSVFCHNLGTCHNLLWEVRAGGGQTRKGLLIQTDCNVSHLKIQNHLQSSGQNKKNPGREESPSIHLLFSTIGLDIFTRPPNLSQSRNPSALVGSLSNCL